MTAPRWCTARQQMRETKIQVCKGAHLLAGPLGALVRSELATLFIASCGVGHCAFVAMGLLFELLESSVEGLVGQRKLVQLGGVICARLAEGVDGLDNALEVTLEYLHIPLGPGLVGLGHGELQIIESAEDRVEGGFGPTCRA